MNKLYLLVLTAFINGCGGGGTSTDSNPALPQTVGKVADGYINGAIVFWDCNGNKTLDSSEIQTKSSAGGVFSIQAAPNTACVLVAKVPLGAIDEDAPTTPINAAYTLVSTKGNENFISPLSTLVAAHMAQNPTTSLSDSQTAVASLLGISGNINSDYISVQEGDHLVRRGVAKIAAAILQKNNLPSSSSSSLFDSYAEVQSQASNIRQVDFSSSTSINNFINPFKGFLRVSPYSVFSKYDTYYTRPNSKRNLTETQLLLLDSIISDANLNDNIRNGVINFHEMEYPDLVAIAGKLRSATLIAGDENALVKQIRLQRQADIDAAKSFYTSNLNDKVTFFSSDIASNLLFINSVAISGAEAVSGAVSTATGLPSVDLRPFRNTPKLKKATTVIKNYRIGDLIDALMKGIDKAGKALSAESKNQLTFLSANNDDNTQLTVAQFTALADLVGLSIDIGKDMIKKGDISTVASFFGPALNIYGAASGDCSDATSGECFTDLLQVLESVAEWAHLGDRTAGALQWLRATVDAYITGKNYADATDKEITLAQTTVINDWDARTKFIFKSMLLKEISVAGIDNLFEAYDPSIPCAANQTRSHGACRANISTTFQVNPIIFKNTNNGTTTYNSGLVLYMPTSTAYDNATVAGIGTEKLTGGVAVLQTVSGQSSLQVMQSNGIASGDILQIQAPVATDYIPAGSVYTVKLYKGTNLVATQTVTLAAKLVTPQEGATAEFPSVTLTTYADLCPNGVATTAPWYSIPSSRTPSSPQVNLSCGSSSASANVESGDTYGRRFNTTLTVAKPTPPPSSTSGQFLAAASSETGTAFIVPSGVSHCIFEATGTWSPAPNVSNGAAGWGAVTSWPGYSTLTWPIPTAPAMSLIVKTPSGSYILIGSFITTLNVTPNTTMNFLMNDGVGAHYDNSGSLTVGYSCQ